jgi:FdhD protein
MIESSITKFQIIKVGSRSTLNQSDSVTIEEPLEIRLCFGPAENRAVKNISVTMRTLGADVELAVGFLFTEGIIQQKADLASVDHCFIACAENKENVIQVELTPSAIPNLPQTDRNFYTSSSCGVCGKGSIDAIRTISMYTTNATELFINQDVLTTLPDKLRKQQEVFESTGGLHACALFTTNGDIVLVREDVGRHNALDKLIGAAIEHDLLPLSNHILLLSGRASFELIQKATMAGIQIIAAIGAPSSLAVELSTEFDITLVGFLRSQQFNIYNAAHRILIK